MIKNKLQVNSVTFDDVLNLKVKRTMHDSNASSTFTATFDTPFGKHKSDFTVGQTVDIFADETDATTKIFSGVIEKIRFTGKENTQKLTLSGRDYSLRLQDITAQPQVFNNTETSEIVTGLLTSNSVPDITTTNVNVTSTILSRMSYNHESLFDAFNELAMMSNSIFWVDEDKDLHWIERKSSSSGVTIGDSQNNLLDTDLNRSREGMANIIHVYGDRYLSGFKEQLSIGSPVGGSVFELISRPHNTEILYLGSSLKGSVKDITLTPTSGPDYAVDFFDRQVIFLSGTDIGYDSIPPSGGSVIVNYQRELPIVKCGQNDDSIKFYGPKTKVIRDKSIKDPNTALDLLQGALQDSNPLNRLKCKLKGWFTFTPGQTVIYDLSNFNISEIPMSIVEIQYNFNKNSIQDNSTISLVLSKKLLDITDKMKELDRRLVNIESPDISDSDVVTRLIQSKEECIVVGSCYSVYTSTVTGSQYHLYGTSFIPPINPWHLASGTDQGHLAGSYTGSASAFSPFSLQLSGGNDYSVTGSYNDVGSESPGGFGIHGFGFG